MATMGKAKMKAIKKVAPAVAVTPVMLMSEDRKQKLKSAYMTLSRYMVWRKGHSEQQPDPVKIGEALSVASGAILDFISDVKVHEIHLRQLEIAERALIDIADDLRKQKDETVRLSRLLQAHHIKHSLLRPNRKTKKYAERKHSSKNKASAVSENATVATADLVTTISDTAVKPKSVHRDRLKALFRRLLGAELKARKSRAENVGL